MTDLIIVNAKVTTLDAPNPVVEAEMKTAAIFLALLMAHVPAYANNSKLLAS